MPILELFYYYESVRVCFDAESSNYPMKEEILVACSEKKKITILFVRYFVFDIFSCSQVHVQTCALFMHTSAQNARSRY